MKFKDIEGKTIRFATQVKREKFDDDGWLLLEFTDGSKCVITAGYGAFTNASEGEYPTSIGITSDIDGFIPVD